MHRWKLFATHGYNKNQMVAYANVPLLAVPEITRRAGKTPTVSSVVADVIAGGFTPKQLSWWPPRGTAPSAAQLKQMHQWLASYFMSAEKRGLCRLR